MSYAKLEREQEKPRKIRDWTERWEQLTPLLAVNGSVRERVEAFAASKQISIDALATLEPRIAIRRGGGVWLAFAGRNGAGTVTAIKYRPLDGSSHDSEAEAPSVWLRPIIVGNPGSLDWFIAEGETDTARLAQLVGNKAAVVCLPAGAGTFKREWADLIPRGATVHLAHDADQDGDAGAEKAAKIVGSKTVRVRPPVEGGDWCDWDGSRDDFVQLVAAARSSSRQYEFTPLDTFLVHPFPEAVPLLGEPGTVILAIGSLLLVYGADGSGKSTWTIDGIVYLAAGEDWLGFPVPRPVRFCVIENEGPPSLFQQKLVDKAASWEGPAWTHNVFVFQSPWGEFSFANPDARLALRGFCEEHQIDVVTANPTLGLGVSGSGRPDDTQQFVDWLTECGLKSQRAFWLLHHENKAGQISGDWGRHPDTKVQLQRDGNQTRTKLDWAKTRWATLPNDEHPKTALLEWITETQGYTLSELDAVGASDNELERRIADFLTEHPMATTNSVMEGVKGTNDRIRKLLNSDRFDCFTGPRSSKLWFVSELCDAQTSDRVGTTSEVPTQ